MVLFVGDLVHFSIINSLEFCIGSPAEQKRRRGIGRQLMRNGAKGLIPDEIRCRTYKTPFCPGFENSFERSRGALLSEFERFGANSTVATYMDLQMLRAVCGSTEALSAAAGQSKHVRLYILRSYYCAKFLETL